MVYVAQLEGEIDPFRKFNSIGMILHFSWTSHKFILRVEFQGPTRLINKKKKKRGKIYTTEVK
jgi:hypothetical protein